MLGPRDLEITRRAGDTILVRSREALGAYPRAMPDRLVQWATQHPQRTFLAERTADGRDWRRISYAETLRAVRALAQAVLDHGASASRGVAILSGNGIDHALIALACQYAGIVYAPISPPYALESATYERLRACMSSFDPALVFVDEADRFARALASDAIDAGRPVIATRGAVPKRRTLALATLLETQPRAAVDAAFAALAPDTVAKILFTSGSTGVPKGVINTQRMLCSNQQMAVQAFPFWADAPIMVDWLPWSHTAGSNQTFNLVLFNGGTMYIDGGKPTPRGFAETIRNLRDISPTLYFNVPRGYDELASALAGDADLRRNFFRRLRMMWYAGAALAEPVFAAMRRLAIDETGDEVLMTSSLGSTETAPSSLFAHVQPTTSGNVGVPLPGVEMKLVPREGKCELRVRGPNVTPGYLHRDDLTAAAFDEEGYHRTGDAVAPIDPLDYRAGFRFDGRFGEDFKLTTGTWVNVSALRSEVLQALAPAVRDVVICGADRDDVTMLAVAAVDPQDPALRSRIARTLATLARAHPGSSLHVARAIVLDPPPSLDDGEITDKGSLNAGIIRKRRDGLIVHLYDRRNHPLVIPSQADRSPGDQAP